MGHFKPHWLLKRQTITQRPTQSGNSKPTITIGTKDVHQLHVEAPTFFGERRTCVSISSGQKFSLKISNRSSKKIKPYIQITAGDQP